MKITAEFNSNEELLSFISTFGTKTLTTGQAVTEVKEPVTAKVEDKKEVEKEASKVEPSKENKKEETQKGDAEVIGGKDATSTEAKGAEGAKEEDPKTEETNITKEMVRAIFTKLIKAGKQKEAKELTAKYGAGKLPDLKEEDYATVYKEAEGLL